MKNNFSFPIPIVRAYKSDDGSLLIEGIASSTTLDTYDTIFNQDCQENFAMCVNDGSGSDEPITMEVEHQGDFEPMNILGPIISASVTKDNQFSIVGRLDEKNPKALYYYDLLTNPDPKLGRPKKLGLSINGAVEEWHHEYSTELEKQIRVFDKVKLNRVGIVRSPSNSDTWIDKIVRSVDWNEKETIAEAQEERNILLDLNNENSTPEVVTRVEYYDSIQLISVLSSTIDAMCSLESWCKDEEYEPQESQGEAKVEKKIGEDALMLLNDVLKKISDLVVLEASAEVEVDDEERDATTANSGALAKEDLSDKVTMVTPAPKVKRDDDGDDDTERASKEDTNDGTDGKAADDSVEKGNEKEKDSNKEDEERSGKKESELEDSSSALDALVLRLSEFEEKFQLLTNNLESANTKNNELVERVKQLENEPATTPGNQILGELEMITREMTADEKRAELIKRAKDSKDKDALLKLHLFKNGPIGRQ